MNVFYNAVKAYEKFNNQRVEQIIASTLTAIRMMKLRGASISVTTGAKIVANFDIVTQTPAAVDVKMVGKYNITLM